MSRNGPESGGLVLRVDQKKWSFFKTKKLDVYSFIISKIRPLRGGGGEVVNPQNNVFYFESDIAKVYPFRPICSSYDSERNLRL
jgi:hypothetical protein